MSDPDHRRSVDRYNVAPTPPRQGEPAATSMRQTPPLRLAAALIAVLGALAILMLSASLSIFALQLFAPNWPTLGPETAGVLTLAAIQMLMLALTGITAGARGSLSETLALRQPDLEPIPRIVAAMAATLVLYSILAFLLAPETLKSDLAQFRPLLMSEVAWLALLCVLVGAPVAEEVLFRGYLLGALRDAGVPISVTVLFSNVMWVALHFSYSIVGLIEVFAAGLFLSWARIATGSVWPSILLHVTYNLVAVAVMLMVVD